MEVIVGGTGNHKATNFDKEDEEEARKRTFSELKTYCLDLLQNPNQNPQSLSHLRHFISRSPPQSLQSFFDYTLFPLLLLFDAAVNSKSHLQGNESVAVDFPNVPHMVSDVAAEGVVQCLEELLKKCHVGSVDQMSVVLKKLTYGAMLSPSEASEEFRGGVIRCFRALLFGLYVCSNKFCSCRRMKGVPTLLDMRDLEISTMMQQKDCLVTEECLIAFLCSQTASAAVGHWLSLLLKAADFEAARGHRGSARLRVEAFVTLRVLVAKVGSAEALAFFLPGVVSQFAKVLHGSKTMTSGASGSASAVDQAVRGLAEFLMIVLEDDANLSSLDMPLSGGTGIHSSRHESAVAFLDKLRHLPLTTQGQNKMGEEYPKEAVFNTSKVGFNENELVGPGKIMGSLNVHRTKDWIVNTASHVNKLLSATFPHLCVHPVTKVRLGLLAAIQGLLSKCSCTLKESRLMLLECLCVLVCDDSEEVSAAARDFLGRMLLSDTNFHIQNEFSEIFSRLIEKLPKVVLGSEESLALSEVQKLLVVIYFSGPQFVANHLLQSSMATARFLDVFALCLSQNSTFAGSLDKLILARSTTKGYLHSITEMRGSTGFSNGIGASKGGFPPEDTKFQGIQNKITVWPQEIGDKSYKLPRMPPWFAYVGGQKLYEALAKILRLVGLSLLADSTNKRSLSIIVDVPLDYLRKLVSEVRVKECNKESWQSWYNRTGSGQLLRQASTAVCILNEIIFGVSDKAFEALECMFEGSGSRLADTKESLISSMWKTSLDKEAKSHLIDCVGSVLHEYLSAELWNLPLDHKSNPQQLGDEVEVNSLHFFHDAAMLYQVIIDGIGVFSICLEKDFCSSGFLHSSLYVLLENLICSSFQVRSASDAVLQVISTVSGYPTVGHLVLANSDYVIDSICRQLRHLDLNPHVPNVLASMLSYIGVAHKILPLLEEPMRSVSLELEILGRHQHPDLTVAFLKAVDEISKASKCEACLLPQQAKSFLEHVKSKTFKLRKKITKEDYEDDIDMPDENSGEDMGACLNGVNTSMEEWETIMFTLNDSKRYRRTVGAIAGSCVTAATPLLSSLKQEACLVALDIIENGVMAIAQVEEAYEHEKATKEVILEMLELCSYYSLKDTMDAADDPADENRLLPAANKIWPFLVTCIQNKNPLAVRRCSVVISKVVQICGGDFFSRRFYTDGSHFWKLLSTSPFYTKPFSKPEKTPLQLPYRTNTLSTEISMAEGSTIKVQAAILNMIGNLTKEKRSASALEAVLKKVSGIVVGIACSGVTGLRDASLNALRGLSLIDPDLIWLLLADVYYSKKKDLRLPPTSYLPQLSQILPPSSSLKDYLFVRYGGQSYGFDIDFFSVELVFNKFQP